MPERWISIAKILHDKGARFDIDAGDFDKSCGMLAGNPIALDAIAAFKRSVLPALPRQVYEAAISNDLRTGFGKRGVRIARLISGSRFHTDLKP